MTGVEVVQDEARKLGVGLSAESADAILWEYTGYPSFYEGEAEECIRRQTRAYLTNDLYAWQTQCPLPASTAPTSWERLEENSL